MPLNNILLTTDFTDNAREAYAAAGALARRFGATLHLAHVAEPLNAALSGIKLESCLGEIEDALENEARDLSLENVVVKPRLLQHRRPHEALLDFEREELPRVATRLEQVFVNLLANANKFAPAGSRISVGGAVAAGSVSVCVDDEGPGLAQWPPDGLFARFDRLAGREPDAGGVGLGLSIVKSIVERHGGQVAAKSSEHGTRMTVTLLQLATNEDTGR